MIKTNILPYVEVVGYDDNFQPTHKLNEKGEEQYPMWKDFEIHLTGIESYVSANLGLINPFDALDPVECKLKKVESL